MTSNQNLFHAAIGFPSTFRAHVGEFSLSYTKHAFHAALNDKYLAPGEVINLPHRLVVSTCAIIEIEHSNYRTSKILYRAPYDSHFDLCIAVIPGVPMVVKTVWLQAKSDSHKTLDRTRYSVPA
jgi:hypothetical protein